MSRQLSCRDMCKIMTWLSHAAESKLEKIILTEFIYELMHRWWNESHRIYEARLELGTLLVMKLSPQEQICLTSTCLSYYALAGLAFRHPNPVTHERLRHYIKRYLHNLECTRLHGKIAQSLCNLTDLSTAVVRRCLFNFKEMGQFLYPISWQKKLVRLCAKRIKAPGQAPSPSHLSYHGKPFAR